MKKTFFLICSLLVSIILYAEDGYRLWLRFDKIDDATLLQQYRNNIAGIQIASSSSTLSVAKQELLNDLQSLLDKKIPEQNTVIDKCIVAGTPSSSPIIKQFLASGNFNLGREGFAISTKIIDGKNVTLIVANNDVGVLYGVFAFLRLLQTHQNINSLSIVSVPKIQNRILDH